jgi:hypothetical protein
MVRIQNRERIQGFERRRLCRVANIAEQTCFVGNMATLQLRFDDGDWPSGKALGSGPRIGGSNPSSPARENAFESLILSQDKSIRISHYFYLILAIAI